MSKKKSNSSKKSSIKKKNNKDLEIIVKSNVDNLESFLPYYLLIAVIILFVFGFIYGLKVLNPGYTEWLFASNGDLMQHYVGWESYRFGDWKFPIGLTNATSYPTNISVIYTDSIPLIALFLKIFSFILPKTFQYFGLYGLLCFILQGIFSARIAKKFTDSKLNIIVIAVLFTIVPSMLFRMFYHTALASQWLLLISLETLFLYDDFGPGKKIYLWWGLIGFLIPVIHFYYIVMCGIVLLGFILLDILNTKRIKKSILLLILYIASALFSMWIFGGFTNLTENDAFGFGEYSYNLNGLINSQGWSVFFEELPMLPNQYEGFSYLGLGVMFLIFVAIVLIIYSLIKNKKSLKKQKNLLISLIFISLVCVVVAVSPKVYFGEKLLFNIKLPKFLNDMWAIFRSTGRFVWPIIYILMLGSVIVILKKLNWKGSLLIFSLAVFIQIIDIGPILENFHGFYSQKIVFNDENNIYKDYYLNLVANNSEIELMVLVSDDIYDSDKMLYSDWALNNGIQTNKLHFARTSFDELLEKNTIKFLKQKNRSQVFVFTTRRECQKHELNCYKMFNNNYLGYIDNLE